MVTESAEPPTQRRLVNDHALVRGCRARARRWAVLRAGCPCRRGGVLYSCFVGCVRRLGGNCGAGGRGCDCEAGRLGGRCASRGCRGVQGKGRPASDRAAHAAEGSQVLDPVGGAPSVVAATQFRVARAQWVSRPGSVHRPSSPTHPPRRSRDWRTLMATTRACANAVS